MSKNEVIRQVDVGEVIQIYEKEDLIRLRNKEKELESRVDCLNVQIEASRKNNLVYIAASALIAFLISGIYMMNQPQKNIQKQVTKYGTKCDNYVQQQPLKCAEAAIAGYDKAKEMPVETAAIETKKPSETTYEKKAEPFANNAPRYSRRRNEEHKPEQQYVAAVEKQIASNHAKGQKQVNPYEGLPVKPLIYGSKIEGDEVNPYEGLPVKPLIYGSKIEGDVKYGNKGKTGVQK